MGVFIWIDPAVRIAGWEEVEDRRIAMPRIPGLVPILDCEGDFVCVAEPDAAREIVMAINHAAECGAFR